MQNAVAICLKWHHGDELDRENRLKSDNDEENKTILDLIKGWKFQFIAFKTFRDFAPSHLSTKH